MATKKVVALMGQSYVDVALQHYGTMEGFMQVLRLNGARPNDKLTPGQSLTVDEITSPVLDYIRRNELIIVSSARVRMEGISYWKIGVDFRVS